MKFLFNLSFIVAFSLGVMYVFGNFVVPVAALGVYSVFGDLGGTGETRESCESQGGRFKHYIDAGGKSDTYCSLLRGEALKQELLFESKSPEFQDCVWDLREPSTTVAQDSEIQRYCEEVTK